jgi:hypothetical protein
MFGDHFLEQFDVELEGRLGEVVTSSVLKPFHPRLSYCPTVLTVEK